MSRYVLLLGGNVGDVARTFDLALAEMAVFASVAKLSERYTSKAWGFESDDFLNQAVEIDCELEPVALLDRLQQIECALGRTTKSHNGQYAARPIDIDILYCGSLVVDTPRLSIPHLLIARRQFALQPLMDICPDFVDPRTGKSIREMLAQC